MINILTKFRNLSIKIRKRMSRRIYISIGENCLPDHILNRYQLKSYATPFSHARSNVEYLLSMERDQYRDFLNTEFLAQEDLNGSKVVRHKKYREISNRYHDLHMKGFEFTHHDIVGNPILIDTFARRLVHLRQDKSKEYWLFYHHRSCPYTDFGRLLADLSTLREYYSFKYRSQVVLFRQILTDQLLSRKLVYTLSDGIHIFDFYTLKIWEGSDTEILWARCDEDLIQQMMNIVRKI